MKSYLEKNYELKEKIDKAEVVSFDIFDTLILRNYAKPTDLFRHIGESFGISDFVEKRIFAERLARKIQRMKGIDEVSIDQIYASLTGKYKECMNHEIVLEKLACHANPEMKSIYDYCLQQGKRILITSDMYLPSSVIEEILHNAGYIKYEKLFLSSESLKQKADQKMYYAIIEYTKVLPEKILHVGDNAFADNQMAVASGVESYLYIPSWKKQSGIYNNNYFNIIDSYSNESVIPSILKGLIILHEQNNCNEAYWKNFGYKYTGIIVLNYIRWLKKQFDEQGIKKVYFMLRDGYIFKKVFDILYPEYETYEIYGSRTLYMLAGMKDYDDIRIHITGMHREGLTYKRCYERLNIDDENFKLIYNKEFPDWDKEISTEKEFSHVDDFLKRNFDYLKQYGENQRKILLSYFNSIGLFESKCAIVDLGWKASMLKGMLGVCKLENKNPNLYGYYFGTHEADYSNLNIFSYSISSGKPDDVYPYKALRGGSPVINILELMFSAPHASIVGVTNENNIFTPIYQEIVPEEKKRIDVSKDILNGVYDFVSDFKASEGFEIPYNIKSSLCSLEYFDQAITKYDEHEIEKICFFPGVGNDKKCFPILLNNKTGFINKNMSSDKKTKIGIIYPWPGDESAEKELLLRFKKACDDICVELIFLDGHGWILDNRTTNRTNEYVNSKDLDFVISTHFETAKTVDSFYYHVLWNPPEIPMNLPYYTDFVTNNYIMNDDFLIYDNGGMSDHLKTILLNSPRDLDDCSELVGSFPQSMMLEPNLDNPVLFYCGMNWEVVVQGDLSGSRHQGLFKLLDNTDKIKFFGPDKVKAWGNKRPWEGYKCYQYSIPFDGFSILNEINKCGICLVLSSDIHRRAGAVTNRAYEACAAGAVIISDDNEYMMEHFKDAALFITYNKKNPVDTFNQIMEKYYWIISHKEEALLLAKKAQSIFRERFALDLQLRKVIEDHPKRIKAVQNVLFAKDSLKKVLVTYIVDTLDEKEAEYRLEKIIDNVNNQLYKNIILAVACDISIEKEIKDYCKNYNNIQIVGLALYDKKGSRYITKGVASRNLLHSIEHDYFIATNPWEVWFKDHITTLIRALENNQNAMCSYSGSLRSDCNYFPITNHFDVYTQSDLYQLISPFINELTGAFLFKKEIYQFTPDYAFSNMDGLEHLFYMNFIKVRMKKELVFSKRMTINILIDQAYDRDFVVPIDMQVRLIRDFIRFDVAEEIRGPVGSPVQSLAMTSRNQDVVLEEFSHFPIKVFIKRRLLLKFPKMYKIYLKLRKLKNNKK